jgi:hypothetical protein
MDLHQINTASSPIMEPLFFKPLEGIELYVFMGFVVVSVLVLWFGICWAIINTHKN